jgi:hypothetical protein
MLYIWHVFGRFRYILCLRCGAGTLAHVKLLLCDTSAAAERDLDSPVTRHAMNSEVVWSGGLRAAWFHCGGEYLPHAITYSLLRQVWGGGTSIGCCRTILVLGGIGTAWLDGLK